MAYLGLHVGLKALLTAQSALDTIGHNISNANTPGYSRQSLSISAARPMELRGLLLGNGVQADAVTRTVDDLLGRRIVGQIASMSKLDESLGGMSRIEAFLGEPEGFGLGGLLDQVFARFSDLSANPEDRVLRTGVTQGLGALTAQFHALSTDVADVQADSLRRLELAAEAVNGLTRHIVSLNREIARSEATGGIANDLRDQRDEALRELGAELDITYHEDEQGAVRVLTGGQLLVGSQTSNELAVRPLDGGGIELRLEAATAPIRPRGGRLGGALALIDGFLPELGAKLDRLARNLILETNRVHSTGIPPSGGFERLVGTYALEDGDHDGLITDELLAGAGLEFPIQDGELFVHVRSKASGEIATTRIAIESGRTTVGDLIGALEAIPGIGASLDPFGRLQVYADSGSTFDFGRRSIGAPDAAHSFGGASASLGTAGSEPFALAPGDTLDLAGPLGNFTVTFDAADFADISQATAAELAAAIGSEPAIAANGMRAVVVGGTVVLQTIAGGSSASFDVVGGSALAALGWTAGTTVAGQDTAVQVAVSGTYTGADNRRFHFRPTADGVIGTTSGLAVEVLDESGAVVATLDVGADYLPGTELEIGEGIRVSFTAGAVSSTDHDGFALHAIADSDSADVLVALGLNSLLVGTDARDIALRADIERDPMLLAMSASGAPGDNRAALDLIALQFTDVAGLGATLGSFYGDVVSEVGFEVESTQSALDVEEHLVGDLQARRDQMSGVNVDEELVGMIQYEQAFGAAAQYIQVVNSLSEEILSLL